MKLKFYIYLSVLLLIIIFTFLISYFFNKAIVINFNKDNKIDIETKNKFLDSVKKAGLRNIEKDHYTINVEVILTNPQNNDINSFLKYGLKKLDEILPIYFQPEKGLKRIVMEYNDNTIIINFGVRKDCIPIFPKEREKFHKVDIII